MAAELMALELTHNRLPNAKSQVLPVARINSKRPKICFLGKFYKIGYTSEKTIFSPFCKLKLQKWDKTKKLMLS